jgi:hypothetical protein
MYRHNKSTVNDVGKLQRGDSSYNAGLKNDAFDTLISTASTHVYIGVST